MNVIKPFHKKQSPDNTVETVSFHRSELEPILKIYGHMVSSGEWRDYSISSSSVNAIFSVFKHSSEKPLYMIIKNPKLLRKNCLYSVLAMNGQVIKQGGDLRLVLQILNKRSFKII